MNHLSFESGTSDGREGSGTSDGCEGASASIHDILPPADLDSDVLVIGPALTGKQDVALDLLGGVFVTGGLPFCVTTSDPARVVREKFDSRRSADTQAPVAIVDCLAEMQGTEIEDKWTKTVATPADLTGIGIALSEARRNLGEGAFDDGRLLVDSITTALMYAEYEPVYKFLHKLTGQFGQYGGLTIATLDSDAVESAQERSIQALFDVAVETRRQGTGPTEFRVRGDGVDVSTGWYQYQASEHGGDR